MQRSSKAGPLRAMAGSALIAALLGAAGCSDQYAGVGTVDMAASKAIAEKNGLKKFEPRTPRKKSPGRGPAVIDDKPTAPPGRGSIPK